MHDRIGILKVLVFKKTENRERTDTFQRVLINSLVLRGKTNYKKITIYLKDKLVKANPRKLAQEKESRI